MELYRLCRRDHADLTGAGGRRFIGRWHDRPAPIIYTASSRALCLLEVLVHMEVAYDDVPDDYVYQIIQAPDDDVEVVHATEFGPGGSLDTHAACGVFGSQWLAERRSLMLIVPSIIVGQETNIMIDPEHPNATMLRMAVEIDVRWDPRLFKST